MADVVNVHVKLTIDGSEIEAAVPVPAGSAPRRSLLPTLRRLTDTVVALAERGAAERGEIVSCRRGCDACCRQMVPISETEAHGLAATVGAMEPPRAAAIMERFDAAVDRLESMAILPRLLKRDPLDAEELSALDRDYFLAQVPCPFLEDDGACGIHAERPLACREYLVTTPPVFCARPIAGRVQRLELGAKVSLAVTKTESTKWLPLVLARQFVAEHHETTCNDLPKELSRILNALL